MKRFILPAILAIAIHAVIFSIEGKWFDNPPHSNLHHDPVVLSLAYLPAKQEKQKQPPPPAILRPAVKLKKQPEPAVKQKPPPPTQPPKQMIQPRPRIVKPVEKPLVTELKKKTVPKTNLSSNLTEAVVPMQTEEIYPADLPDYIPAVPQTIPPAVNPLAESTASATDHAEKSNIVAAVKTSVLTPIIIEAMPLYKVNPPPRYPRLARKRGYQGTVLLDVFVTRDGQAKDVKVVQSSRYSVLDKAAVKSVQSWRFEPGKKGEEKVAMWVKVPIRFELTK